MRRDDWGAALPLALFALVILSGFLLVFLSMAGMERAISANLTDVARARYLAEAGIEWAFDQLIMASGQTNGWDNILAKDTGQGVEISQTGGQTLPELPASMGTFTVSVRNDYRGNDGQITGWVNPATNTLAPDPGGRNSDTNGIILLTATGNFNGANCQVQVVMTGIQSSRRLHRITSWREL